MTQKSVALTFVLSVIPGLGHLYLGLNSRGLQFMAGAFACIILITVAPLVFPVLLALVWFYSLFDALQRAIAINGYIDRRLETAGQPTIALGDPLLIELDRTVFSPSPEAAQAVPASAWLGGACILAGLLVLFRFLFPSVWLQLFSGTFSGVFLALVLIGLGVGLIWVPLRRARKAGEA
jgi:hypothetical protein